ncbi:MAG: hypothetical protein ICV61_03895 [Microcoleus sp. Co-bin12]|nr:hypothetical protein [Microcoleus sp. Co-bin12]
MTHPREEEGDTEAPPLHRIWAATGALSASAMNLPQNAQDLRPATKETRFFTDIKGLNQIFG